MRAMLSLTTCGALLMSMPCGCAGIAAAASTSPSAVDSAELANTCRLMVSPLALRSRIETDNAQFGAGPRKVTHTAKNKLVPARRKAGYVFGCEHPSRSRPSAEVGLRLGGPRHARARYRSAARC